jgi:hypothetical protein
MPKSQRLRPEVKDGRGQVGAASKGPGLKVLRPDFNVKVSKAGRNTVRGVALSPNEITDVTRSA